MLKKLKIRSKLLVSFACVLVLTLIIAFYSITQLREASSSLKNFMAENVAVDDAVQENRVYSNEIARHLRDMVLSGEVSSSAMETVDKDLALIQANFEVLDSINVLDADTVKKYETAMNNWITIGNKVISQLEANDIDGAKEIILNECTPALDSLVNEVRALSEFTSQNRTNTMQASVNSTNQSLIVLIVILVLAVIIAVLICIKVTKDIVRPMRLVEEAMEGLSQGKMSQNISYDAQDELGNLVNSMMTTCTELESVVQDLTYLLEEMSKGNFNLYAKEDAYKGDFAPLLVAIRQMNKSLSDTMRLV